MITETTTTTGDATTQAQGTGTTAATSGTTTAATGATSTTTESGTSTVNGGAQTTGKEGEGKTGTDGTTTTVPEKYEFKAPEGIELEATAVTEFSALAKDLKLSQADAQKLADVAVKWQQRQIEGHANTVKGWVEQSKTDKEFGGDAFDANLGVARKAIETFGSKELVELLDSTGFGNHPEIVRAFYKAGKAISEGKFIASGARTATPGGASLAQQLYPNMNP